MSMMRAAMGSTRARIVLGALAAYLAWQAWLGIAATWKVVDGFSPEASRVDVVVTLPFTPERFHVLYFQEYGRVSGTSNTAVEVRGVQRRHLRAIARPYWVSRVEPLPRNGG